MGSAQDCYTEDVVIYFNVSDATDRKNECQKAFRRQVTDHLKWAIHVYFLCLDGCRCLPLPKVANLLGLPGLMRSLPFTWGKCNPSP